MQRARSSWRRYAEIVLRTSSSSRSSSSPSSCRTWNRFVSSQGDQRVITARYARTLGPCDAPKKRATCCPSSSCPSERHAARCAEASARAASTSSCSTTSSSLHSSGSAGGGGGQASACATAVRNFFFSPSDLNILGLTMPSSAFASVYGSNLSGATSALSLVCRKRTRTYGTWSSLRWRRFRTLRICDGHHGKPLILAHTRSPRW